MAENYMQLLNHGAQVTSDAFNRIDQAMTQNLQVQQRAGEFAANMTAKAATFAEGARMNDAQITSMKQANYIRGQEFLLRQQLVPLERQEQIMRLELMKEQKQGRLEAQKVAQFNMMTQAYEPMIHDTILKTMSPQLASEYAQYRGKWIGHVANGGGFDGPTYEQGLKKVIGKYSHLKPVDKPWNAQDKFMLERIHPALGQAYDLQNPVLREHKTGLASTYLGMTEAQAGDFMGKYKTLYSNEEWGAIAPARDIYQANLDQIKILQQRAAYLQTDLARAETPAAAARVRAQLDEVNTAAKEALDVNKNLSKNHALGKYGMSDKPITGSATEPDKPEDIESHLDGRKVLGHEPATGLDGTQKAIHQRLGKIEQALIVRDGDGNEVLNLAPAKLDLKYWSENTKADPANFTTMKKMLSYFSETIEEKAKALDDVGKKKYDVSEVINEQSFNKLLGLINKPIQVPLTSYLDGGPASPYYQKAVKPSSGFGYSNFIDVPGFIKLGKRKAGEKSVTTYQDILNIVNKIENKVHREQTLKDLFAAVATGATALGVTPQ